MPDFVLNRNHILAGFGHRIEFRKGEPTHVPPILVKEAAAIGAERVDGESVDPLPDEKVQPAILTAAQRIDELVSAIDMIVERNSSDDFGGDNRPSLDAINNITRLTNPALTKRERDEAWKAYKAKKDEQ